MNSHVKVSNVQSPRSLGGFFFFRGSIVAGPIRVSITLYTYDATRQREPRARRRVGTRRGPGRKA